jgi:site-specific DNA-methyltransferase (adenine-specific)
MRYLKHNGKISYFYNRQDAKLIYGNALEILSEFKDGIFDAIFADPPYFLSSGGISCQSGKQVSVNKGSWDEGMTLEEKHAFNRAWIRECKRLLSPTGSIWISGTLHNIYSVGMALEQEGYKILNNITWQKRNPPPNLACRCFTHSTETILWARPKETKHYFNYALMKDLNGGKQMKDVWTGSLTPQKEKTAGKHPTQKPEYLLEKIILASTEEGGLILDPFVGSGTTSVVAKRLGRKSIGLDSNKEYLEIAVKRLEGIHK